MNQPGQQGQFQVTNPAAIQTQPYQQYQQVGQGSQYPYAPAGEPYQQGPQQTGTKNGQEVPYNTFETEQMHWKKFLEAEDPNSLMTDVILA